jgi:hypothetical protein
MSGQPLSATEAATRLRIAVPTLYGWLGESDVGLLVIQGQPVTIRYYQGGARGQGRITIDADEVERLRELMRVVPQRAPLRRPPTKHNQFPGITVPLGRPADGG